MSDEATRTFSPEERLQEIVVSYRAARAAGEAPPIDEVIGKHPDLAEPLRALLSEADPAAPTLDHPGPTPDPGSPTLSLPGAPPPGPGLSFPRDFGDYELLEEIARGGMGVVYKARQKSPHRIVALKMILAGQLATPEQVRRFHTEAEEAGNLDHPHIMPIYQVGEEQGHHYFTMKLIEGGSLGGQVRHDPRAAVRLLAKVARAVHYAHQRGILHRDIKPDNILIDAQGEPLVTDFGLAKHLAGPTSTQSGAVVGTPSYMAPEQAAARKNLSVAADVYGLGAVLYDLLTGRPPFRADTSLTTLLQVMEREPDPPRALNPQIDRDLETICLKCLEKDPQRRYGSALRLAEDLDHYLAGEPIHARPVGRLERTAKWMRRRPAWAGLVVVSMVAVLGLSLGGWWFSGRLQAALSEAELRRQAAEEQRQSAQASAAEANRQRERVEAGFRKRLEVAEDFLLRMDGRLSRLGAPRAVRVEFVHDILKMSEGLLKENPDDPEARHQTALLARNLGDLWRDGRNHDEGRRAYARALELHEGLVEDFPGKTDYCDELAITHAHQAELSADEGRFAEGEKAFDEAIRLQDELAARAPQTTIHRWRGASYRFRRANLLERAGKAREAEQGYRDALARQELLVADQPGEARYHADLAATAFSLAWLLDEGDPEAALPLWEKHLRASRQAFRLAPTGSSYSRNLREAYFDLAGALRQQGKHAELPALADELRQDFPNDFNETYNAACLLAYAARSARQSRDVPEAERDRLADGYAARAVKYLEMAVREGYRDRAHMGRDPDLGPLRQRQDYQELVAELDRRLPAAPPTPAKDLAALQAEYQGAFELYDHYRRTAETVAQEKKAASKRPRFGPFAQRFLRFAREHKDDPAAVEALLWLVEQTAPRAGRPTSPPLARAREQALQALEADHLGKPELAKVCRKLGESPSPDCVGLLRAALEKHAASEVRGLAGYALALALARQAEQARQGGASQAEDLLRSAEEQLEGVQKEYASVPYGETTLGEVARDKLYELRHLSVGRQAPEIEGEALDGKPMKLSEHRGKVVVLDFWADWCGYCRQMYPHEKALVKRHAGKPFALVGVNCDDDKAQAKRAVEKEGLNWRSWSDAGRGDRIRSRWQVDSFPTIYVLDGEGVIRYKFEGLVEKELDDAIDQLLKEAARGKPGGPGS